MDVMLAHINQKTLLRYEPNTSLEIYDYAYGDDHWVAVLEENSLWALPCKPKVLLQGARAPSKCAAVWELHNLMCLMYDGQYLDHDHARYLALKAGKEEIDKVKL